jgi:hypothetical protein
MSTRDDDTQELGDQTRYFLMAFRKVGDAFEQTTLSAAEIPLNVLSSLGVSDDTTEAARRGGQAAVDTIHGTVDSVATSIAKAVNSQVSLASDVVKSATGGKD